MKHRRRKNLYFGLGPAPTPSKRERARQKKEFQAGVARKRKGFKRERETGAAKLFRQLQKDARPQRAHRAKMLPGDEERWRELLRSNPGAVLELAQLVGGTMAKKKKNKKKRNPKKGKMPAGLAAYWRKKRAAKAKRKKKRNPKPRKVKRVRRRKPVMRRRNVRKPRRQRRRRSNPIPKRAKVLKAPYGMTGKRLKAWAREQGRKYGVPARVL